LASKSKRPAAPKRPTERPKRTHEPQTSQPEIRIGYTPAGRQTLEAIEAELLPLPIPAARGESSPEISVRESFAERDTLAAIIAEAAKPQDAAAPKDTIEVFEMVTFVVRGVEAARLSSEALRRRFVEERLMKRLPVSSMNQVDRVDVTPWTVQGTLVLRVWCRSP
jgi:hypothetical protein